MPIDPRKFNKSDEKPVIIRQTLEFTEDEYVRFMDLLSEAENELTPGDAPIWGHYKSAMIRAKISDGYYDKLKRKA